VRLAVTCLVSNVKIDLLCSDFVTLIELYLFDVTETRVMPALTSAFGLKFIR
jgi:hypothetical protein